MNGISWLNKHDEHEITSIESNEEKIINKRMDSSVSFRYSMKLDRTICFPKAMAKLAMNYLS